MERVKLSRLKANPANPRIIKDEKFHRLVDSILEFPKMLELRPVVTDVDMTVLGGNMRLRALQHISKMTEAELRGRLERLGRADALDYWLAWQDVKDVPAVRACDLTDAEKRQFVIKDNASFGQWDWDAIANEWDEGDLTAWGVDLPTGWNDTVTEDVNPDDFGDEFSLPNEGKAKFGTMTFTVTDQQRDFINDCILLATNCEGMTEVTDNKNENGAALFLICKEWFASFDYKEKPSDVVEKEFKELRQYLRNALKASGRKCSDVDALLGTSGMSGHYFGESQWMFPTREAYEKLKTIMTLDRDYMECKLIEMAYNRAKKRNET